MNSEERELRVGWNTENGSERGVAVVKHTGSLELDCLGS